jgi:diguanylate cyclase (GGDEF)-like protein
MIKYYLFGGLVLLTYVILMLLKKIRRMKAVIQVKDEEMKEINSKAMDTEKNEILSKILEVCMEQDELTKSCEKLMKVFVNNFNIDYCSFYIPDERGKYRIIATNIRDVADCQLLEEFTNAELKNLTENDDGIAYSSPMIPIQEPFAKERGIKYYFLIPLKINGKNIGAFTIENCNTNPKDSFEEEFFHKAERNATISLNKFLFDDLNVRMAQRDGLTQIYNRTYMTKHINSEISKHRMTNSKFTLVMLDVDFFKKFNDTYGHLFGDEVLKSLARFFEQKLRKTDYVARYGGEEFMLFFPNSKNVDIFPRLDEMREELSKMPVTMTMGEETKTAFITASFGMAEYPIEGVTVESLLECADKALYCSKMNGRNRITMYRDINR